MTKSTKSPKSPKIPKKIPRKIQERSDKIGLILDELYPNPPIPLDHKDAFTLLIAVLLSAQTTDVRVNIVTPDLFQLADNPYDMAQLSVDQILDAIKTCGLAPTKAKNVHRLSELLIENFNGEVPGNLKDLTSLPGVGHKTAGVVLTQWFDIPAFPIDTHILRLAKRWGLSTSTKNTMQTEADLTTLNHIETWNRRHLQIIYFGREHCPARGHKPDICPICSWVTTEDPKLLEFS